MVQRCGLVGVPNGAGETAVVCVELSAEHRLVDRAALRAELLALARAHAVTKDVSEILFIDRLPVDPRHNSKIERPKLAAWAAATIAREGPAGGWPTRAPWLRGMARLAPRLAGAGARLRR
jgi:hypothetical protein